MVSDVSKSIPFKKSHLQFVGMSLLVGAIIGVWFWPAAKNDSLPHAAKLPVAPVLKKVADQNIPAPKILANVPKQKVTSEFTRFNQWTEKYLAANSAERAALLPEGVELARLRRTEMKLLIQGDPQQAIASSVPVTVRTKLPAEIVGQLEERISGKGELSFLAITPAPGQTVAQPYSHSAQLNGKFYDAFVYGRRQNQSTKIDVSIWGVAVDNQFAVSDSPLRVLEAGEVPLPQEPIDSLCPISGKNTPVAPGAALNVDATTAVEVGGKIHLLCSAGHVSDYEAKLIQAEDAAGPYSVEALEADGGAGTSDIVGRPPVSWSQGSKKVLVIRVAFLDLTGTPVNIYDHTNAITDDYVVNCINQTNGVRDFYNQASYNKTTLLITPTTAGDSPDVTPVFTLPSAASYYATNNANSQLHTDAENLALTNGIVLTNYDRIGVVFSSLSSIPGSQINFGGLSDVQGKRFWINGEFDFRVVAHELGHTYGLMHANLWQVSDGNPVSSAGSSTEYGDSFDVMSSGATTIQNHFNQWAKNLLQWIPDSAVSNITAAGTYRVYRFDHPSAALTNNLALKIVRESTHDYWIGYRRAITNNASLTNGAYILWGYNSVHQTDLLDMTTPGTSYADAGLAVGASFTDSAAGITLHPVASGGTSPNEYLDVQIGFTPRVQWASTTYTVDEQAGAATLTLLRGNSSNGTVTVQYTTTDGTAIAPGDYTKTNGTITWAAGDLSPKTISIPIISDSIQEGLENFTVSITNVSGAVVVNGTNATVNIAEPGSFDTAFGEAFVNSTVTQVIPQPDGKLLLCGNFGTIYDTNFNAYTRGGIGRLNADGTLDQNYAVGAGVNSFPVNGMVLQSDGKVIIVGSFTSVHGNSCSHVARLNTDGSLDTSFNPGTGPASTVYAVALQPDGKVIIGGSFTNVAGTSREYIARLNADGSLDTTFVGPDFGDVSGWVIYAILLQPDNKILAAGNFYFNGSPFKSGIVRLNTNGTTDGTFNPGAGAHQSGNTSFLLAVRSMSLQRDGGIVIGGQFTAFNNTNRNYIARLTSTGALDASFDPSAGTTVFATMVLPDQKIAVGGAFTNIGGSNLNRFARLNSNGSVDTNFTVGTGSSGNILGFALRPDTKLIINGQFGTNSGVANRTISQYYTGLPGAPGTAQFAAAAYSGAEGASAALSVARVGGSYGAVSVNYATIPGSAGTNDYTPALGTLSWADGDTNSKTISIPLTFDGVAESAETFIVNLGIPANGLSLGALGQTSVTISTAYNLWKQNHFNLLELSDSSISGDQADPDHDGIPNLLEYASGLDPRASNAIGGKVIAAIRNINATNYLTMSFRSSTSAVDVVYTPLGASNVAAVFTNGPVQVGSPTYNGDGTATILWRDSVPITTNAPRRFMLLKVSQSP